MKYFPIDIADRLHKTATLSLSIPRIYVYVPAPEAFGTMIGISITFYLETTVKTVKIFNILYK